MARSTTKTTKRPAKSKARGAAKQLALGTLSASAMVGAFAAAHVEDDIVDELLARLVDLAVAREDEAGHDQRLCAGAAFGEPPVDEYLIGALLGHARL